MWYAEGEEVSTRRSGREGKLLVVSAHGKLTLAEVPATAFGARKEEQEKRYG
jgi:hypothetical protein